MFTNRIISYGISTEKKNKKAVLLTMTSWLDALERCRKSFGLEGITYEYWCYPTPNPEGSIWIKGNKNVLLFLSEGFLKIATEPQAVALMESLNASNFQEMRLKNKHESLAIWINNLKGESRHYRYWISSFFLYPLERFLKIAKI